MQRCVLGDVRRLEKVASLKKKFEKKILTGGFKHVA